jgi:alkaline phosphatase D
MKRTTLFIYLVLGLMACRSITPHTQKPSELVIAFGSCNNQDSTNLLWKDIVQQQPKAWIWGGDIIYADTDDTAKMNQYYKMVLDHKDYKKLAATTKILGTWDDHDYGKNDGGVGFKAKKQSQQALLDFLGVPKTDKRRQQEGVYHAETMVHPQGSVKIIVLDTRYFRSDLTKDKTKRYQPNKYGEGTMLGATQWQWLEQEMTQSKADFNIIMSSVQVLSWEHGYETWGNMPHERDKLLQLIAQSQAKGVVLLSGDRHMSEFSKTTLPNMAYPLIDFTSSGMTHTWSNIRDEPNPYRVGKLIPQMAYGLLTLDFSKKAIKMQIRGKNGVVHGELEQKY